MIPAAVAAQIAALQSTFLAARPVEKAPPLVFRNLANEAASTLDAIEAAFAETGLEVDAFVTTNWAPIDAPALVALAETLRTHTDLFEAGSRIGRFAATIHQLGEQL